MTRFDTITRLFLSSSLTLIALLRAGPDALRNRLLHLLRIKSQPDLQLFIRRLVWFADISALIAGNRFLNYWARNNYVLPKKTDWDWPNEIAVVTGGSGGIGGEIVKGLAKNGVKIAIIDITEPIQFGAYKNVHFFKCDITVKENVDAIAAEIKNKLGAPTILCNNAGVAHAHTMLESTPAYLRKLFDINVISHFYTIQAFLPDMITSKKGHVVSTCSMSSFICPPGLVDYASTKAAVMSMHEGLANELKYRYKAPMIRTTVVHPTYVRTPLVSWANSLEKSKALQMTPEYVGAEIVEAILSGSSQQVVLPRQLGWTSAFRALPWWFQEIVRGGTQHDMKEDIKKLSV